MNSSDERSERRNRNCSGGNVQLLYISGSFWIKYCVVSRIFLVEQPVASSQNRNGFSKKFKTQLLSFFLQLSILTFMLANWSVYDYIKKSHYFFLLINNTCYRSDRLFPLDWKLSKSSTSVKWSQPLKKIIREWLSKARSSSHAISLV